MKYSIGVTLLFFCLRLGLGYLISLWFFWMSLYVRYTFCREKWLKNGHQAQAVINYGTVPHQWYEYEYEGKTYRLYKVYERRGIDISPITVWWRKNPKAATIVGDVKPEPSELRVLFTVVLCYALLFTFV